MEYRADPKWYVHFDESAARELGVHTLNGRWSKIYQTYLHNEFIHPERLNLVSRPVML